MVKVQTFEPIRNNRHWQGRLTAVSQVRESGTGAPNETITLDLNAVKQNSKSRKCGAPNDRSSSLGWKKAGVSTVEIALVNIEKAQLVPEI